MVSTATFVKRNGLGACRRGVFALAIALALPVAARAAACAPVPSTARVTPAVRSLVDGIDARGFERFSRAGASGARDERSGSPVLDWYFDMMESGSALATRPVGTRAFLAGLSRVGIDLSGRMWADPAESRYSAADATALARNYCVPTQWEKLATNRSPFQPWKAAHVPQLQYLIEIDDTPSIIFVAGMKSALPHIPTTLIEKLPYFSHAGVRGARIEGRMAKMALYLFWGKRGALKSFRKSLDLQRWKSVRDAFNPTSISLSNVAYGRSYSFSRQVPGEMFFGFTALPQAPHQHGIAGSGFLHIGSRNAVVEVGEGVAGTLKPER